MSGKTTLIATIALIGGQFCIITGHGMIVAAITAVLCIAVDNSV